MGERYIKKIFKIYNIYYVLLVGSTKEKKSKVFVLAQGTGVESVDPGATLLELKSQFCNLAM